ncbi:MAG: hypothetical protein IKO14_02900 [Oscillibacter sp.]|nr:hypothetical protein [Oscillibacter sp.]
MANVESMVRKAHFYIAPWYAEGVTKAPVMTREEKKAWYEKFEADFGSLQRNREKLSVETLQTKYAKSYNRLITDLKAGVDTLLDYHIQTFVVNGLPTHPLDRDGLERFVKRTNGIIREETAPGRLLEQAKAALIDGLDMEKCWELVYRIYERIEQEAFYPYWMRHCFRRNGRVYNDIIDKWWRPVQSDGSERWTNEDGTLYDVTHNGRHFHAFNFPPKEAAPWENAAIAEMPRCKGCGAPILWHKTAAGKLMPCDPDPVAYWERPGATGKVLTAWTQYSERGRLASCDFAGTPGTESGIGYVPHWATCPNWRDFKKN